MSNYPRVVIGRDNPDGTFSQGAPGYSSADDAMNIRGVQKKFRDSFSGSSLRADRWVSNPGSGHTVAVASNALTITSGVTAGTSTKIESVDTFTVPFRVSFGVALSQRIANQDFFVEFFSVDPATGLDDGLHSAGWDFDGVTATQGKYVVQCDGNSVLSSSAQTVSTTAAGSMFEIECFPDETWFHSGVVDSVTPRSQSYRRQLQIPDPNALYKLRLRMKNGGTAPASSTTATINFVSCEDYMEIMAEISSGRGATAVGQALAVNVANAPTVTANEGTPVSPTTLHQLSAATTNLTAVKASAGNLYSIRAFNSGAGIAYLKLYNKASAPVPGTDLPVQVFPIPAGGSINESFGTKGMRLATGIATGVTGAYAFSDTTAVAAQQVLLSLSYV
jgi:hypothetical protein